MFDHMIETMLPVHCHFPVPILIQKQESPVSAYNLLIPWRFPVLNNCPEALRHIFRQGQFPRSRICLCGFNHQLHVRSPLELAVNVENFVFQVNIPQSQPAEPRNPQPRMETDIDHFIMLPL